ncbi:MAG: hypothetical protein J2P18_20745, partial [Nocardia sp.]|nr:hypothetical protein [Nocardia sp.]
RFTGTQAYDWGLTFATVPADDVAAAADRLAATLATKAPLSIGRMKSMLRLDPTLDVALSSEPTHLLDLMQTRDWAEGVAAFAERRTPVFQGE